MKTVTTEEGEEEAEGEEEGEVEAWVTMTTWVMKTVTIEEGEEEEEEVKTVKGTCTLNQMMKTTLYRREALEDAASILVGHEGMVVTGTGAIDGADTTVKGSWYQEMSMTVTLTMTASPIMTAMSLIMTVMSPQDQGGGEGVADIDEEEEEEEDHQEVMIQTHRPIHLIPRTMTHTHHTQITAVMNIQLAILVEDERVARRGACWKWKKWNSLPTRILVSTHRTVMMSLELVDEEVDTGVDKEENMINTSSTREENPSISLKES